MAKSAILHAGLTDVIRVNELEFGKGECTSRDLAALGLTLESAVGRRLVFVFGDADEHGNTDDIMCNSVIVRDPSFGILLEGDESGI